MINFKNTYHKILSVLEKDTKTLIKEFEKDVERYNSSREIIFKLSGGFIESQSISQFLKTL